MMGSGFHVITHPGYGAFISIGMLDTGRPRRPKYRGSWEDSQAAEDEMIAYLDGEEWTEELEFQRGIKSKRYV